MLCLTLLVVAGLSNLVYGLDVKGPLIPKQILTTGITSLASNKDRTTLVAGTKSGRILTATREVADNEQSAWVELPREEYGSKFPVYSLALGRDAEGEVLFAGAGDRLVSTWRKKSGSFRFSSTLGPHTGWVKDTKYHQKTDTLFSIGCNCIESWDCSQTPIRHVSKRAIENSPEMGSTLSSDLLSLCLIDDLCLVSGGVDGRVHLWSLDPLEMGPFSYRCHDGRVNSLAYSATMGLIFSVGHDGMMVASTVKTDSLQVLSEVEVMGSPRLSTVFIIDEDASGSSCKLALGTTDGRLIILTVEKSDDKTVMNEESRLELDGQPMIYSICSFHLPVSDGCPYSILIGHATGMHQVWLH